MPLPLKLETATMEEIWWDEKGRVKTTTPSGNDAKKFKVQFNPQTLKVNFTNQKAGGDQPKGSSTQFVGKGVTKLNLELWFDIALAQAQGRVGTGKGIDVRSLTQEVAYFMAPQKATVSGKKGLAPPGLRFQWGSFIFEGVMDSMDETLDLFSAEGEPLRASVAISVSKQEIQYDAAKAAALQDVGAPGIQPYTAAKAGQSVQQMAGAAGQDWKDVALANGIENPRMLAAGALVNLSAGVSVGVSAQLGVEVGAGAQVGVSGGFSAEAGFGVSSAGQASAGAALTSVSVGGQSESSGAVGAQADASVSGGIGAGF